MPSNIDIIYNKVLDRYIEIVSGTKLCSLRFVPPGKQLKEKRHLRQLSNWNAILRGKQLIFHQMWIYLPYHPLSKSANRTRKIKYGKPWLILNWPKNRSKAYRAVGNALGKNPIPIVIPCHRVVAKKGIGGYSEGIDIKTRLLELEQINANNL